MSEKDKNNQSNQINTLEVDKNKNIENKSNKKLGESISSKLLLPMSIVFLAICLSSSLIISGSMISKSLKDAGISVASSGTTNTAVNPTPAATATPVPVSIDQVKALFSGNYLKFGKTDSKLLFVEFSDPSCPYCHVAGGKDAELNSQMGSQFKLASDGGSYIAPVEEMRKLVNDNKAGFVWVYTNGHGNGEMGTRALYCANDKGKFWEVHDLLMSNAGYNLLNNDVKNDKTKSQQLADFLKGAVDPNEMKSCIDSGKYDNRISSDVSVASSFGVSGTPGFFVNTTRFDGAYNWTDMKSTADAALQ